MINRPSRLPNFAVNMKKLITILLLTLSLNAFSQADMEDGDGTVPVDGGLSLLLAAGAAYAGRRLYRKGAKLQRK
jgi:hypothetical protein